MLTKAAVTSLSAMLIAAACGPSGPGADLSHAAAMSGCGPADGPVTAILLARDPIASAEPSLPYVRIVIWQPVSELAPQTWDITTDMGPGVWYFTSLGRSESAMSGHVSVTSIDGTNRIDGAVELQFPSRRVVQGFGAAWTPGSVLCG